MRMKPATGIVALALGSALLSCINSSSGQTLPTGCNPVTAGVRQSAVGNTMTISLPGNRAILEWNDFSIGADQVVQFRFAGSSNAAVLVRVTSANSSSILGRIESSADGVAGQGQILLVNPNGILLGPSSTVFTGGWVASTLNLPDAQFLDSKASKLTFSGTTLNKVEVQAGATMRVGMRGLFLVAHQVANHGSLQAPAGNVGLAAGGTIELGQSSVSGAERLSVTAPVAGAAPSSGAGVLNAGTIQALVTELKAPGGNLYALDIQNEGAVRATTAGLQNGLLVLGSAGGAVANFGILSKEESAAGADLRIKGGWLNATGGTSDLGSGKAMIVALGEVGLGDLTAAQLEVTAGGNISQTGHLEISGTTMLTVQTGGLTLMPAGNNVMLEWFGQGQLSFANTITNDWRPITAPGQHGYVEPMETMRFYKAAFPPASADILLGSTLNSLGSVQIAARGEARLRDLELCNLAPDATFPAMPSVLRNLTLTIARAGLVLPTLTLSGDLRLSAGGPITQQPEPAAVRVAGLSHLGAGSSSPSDITLDNSGNDFGGAVTVDGANIILRVQHNLAVGGHASEGNMSFHVGGAVTLNDIVCGGNLAVAAQGLILQGPEPTAINVSQLGSVTLTADNGLAKQDILLNNVQNVLGYPTLLDGGNVSLHTSAALKVAGRATGNLDLTAGATAVFMDLSAGGHLSLSTPGDITQEFGPGAIQVTGPLALSARDGGVRYSVRLANPNNGFGSSVSLEGQNVALYTGSDLRVGRLIVGGDLEVRTAGEITQLPDFNGIEVAGSTVLQADDGLNPHDLTLPNLDNHFSGTVIVNGQNVALSTASGLGIAAHTTGNLSLTVGGAAQLNDSTVGGYLVVQARGSIVQDTDPSAVVVGGPSSLVARNGATVYDIVLNNANNDFGGLVTVDARTVALNALNGLAGTGQASGNMQLTAGWTLAAGGQVAGALFLTSGSDLTLDDLNVAGNLTALSWGGIVQGSAPAAVKVTGTTALSANDGAARYNIMLANAGNDFGGTVTLDGGDVTLHDMKALALGTVTAAGAVLAMPGGVAPTLRLQGSVQAGGALTLGGTILVVPDGSSYTLTALDAPGDIRLGVGYSVQAANPAPPNGKVQLTVDANGGAGSFTSGAVDGSVTLHLVGH